jgi:hypothetical protein
MLQNNRDINQPSTPVTKEDFTVKFLTQVFYTSTTFEGALRQQNIVESGAVFRDGER